MRAFMAVRLPGALLRNQEERGTSDPFVGTFCKPESKTIFTTISSST